MREPPLPHAPSHLNVDTVNVTRVLMAEGGAARRETLLAHGLTPRAVVAALASGEVRRPYRGVYATPGATQLAIDAAMFRAAASCISLLRLWGIPTIDADAHSHLRVPTDRGLSPVDRRPKSRVVLHRSASMLVGEPAIDIPEALAHARACLSDYAFIAAVDAALHRNLVAERDLGGLAHRCQVPAAWLVARCDRRAESPGETYARLALVDAGHAAVPQVAFERDLRVDLVVDGMWPVEINGRAFHSDAASFQSDHERMRRITALGMTPHAFTVAEVLRDPTVVPRAIAATIAGASR